MGQRSSNGAIISTRRALASKRLMLEEAGAECFDLQHALPPCFCLALRFFWRGAEGVDVGRAGRQPREGIATNLGRIVNAGYLAFADRLPESSADGRVVQECVPTFRSRCSQYHYKQKLITRT